MPLDTSSFPAFLRSLNLDGTPVTTRSGQMIAGPPVPVFEAALRLGFGPNLLDTPQNRSILANLGIPPELALVVGRKLKARSQWRQVWEELARPHLDAVEAAHAQGDTEQTVREIKNALGLINMAYGGDGYYIHTPMEEKREMTRLAERLYRLMRELSGERIERIAVAHPRGATTGLLHFPDDPPGGFRPSGGSSKRWPALLALHPISGDKDSFDFTLALFREAGYATFCIDLPAHGENFDGPRLQYNDEEAGIAALEALAAHPDIDPERLGVMGGSLGAFFAQRTAAISPRVKACLAFASPFDAGKGLPEAVFGIQDTFAHVIGAPTLEEAFEMAKPFHLRDAALRIRCPVAIVHGTQDHICDFTAPYEIARRVQSPVSIFPLVGADHEVAQPGTRQIAGAGIEWLKGVM